MARSFTMARSVLLAAPARDVWAVARTPDGVMSELMPLVRMTFPSSVLELTSDDVVPGERVCVCWLLAGGVLPFDRHALAFESIDDGAAGAHGEEADSETFGFVEESTSWLQRRWRHERTVTALTPGTCRVMDRLTVVPRFAPALAVVRRVVPAVFAHRHGRLVRHWGPARASN